jgi:hypothetical protein
MLTPSIDTARRGEPDRRKRQFITAYVLLACPCRVGEPGRSLDRSCLIAFILLWLVAGINVVKRYCWSARRLGCLPRALYLITNG